MCAARWSIVRVGPDERLRRPNHVPAIYETARQATGARPGLSTYPRTSRRAKYRANDEEVGARERRNRLVQNAVFAHQGDVRGVVA